MHEDDPTVLDVLVDLQGAIEHAEVRVALLQEISGSLDEHDVDLAIDGSWRRAWAAAMSEARAHDYLPILFTEYDVGDSHCGVFVKTDGAEMSRLALDMCGDARGVGMFGVPMRRLLGQTVEVAGIRRADPAWESTYVVAKHIWKKKLTSPALDAAAGFARRRPVDFQNAARFVFGRRLARRMADRARAQQPLFAEPDLTTLLRAIQVRRAFRSPLLPFHIFGRWARRLLRPTGMWIVLSGPDGSGKSSVTAALCEFLAPFFRRTQLLHWSPGALPRPGSLLGRDARDPSMPHEADTHGRVLSFLALLYHWGDHAIGYVTRIRPILIRGGAVVMERGYHDVVVDPRRYRLDVPERLTRALGRFLPRPGATILLLGDPAVLHDRKPELAPSEIARQQEHWRTLLPTLGSSVAIVDAVGARNDVLANVLDAVVSMRAAAITFPNPQAPR